MSVVLNIASQAYLPWNETVTYRSVRPASKDGRDEIVEDLIVARYPLSTREAAASFGVYQAGDVTWTLAKGQLDDGEITPKPRDRIADVEGVEWTVLDATYSPVLGFWKVTARALAVVNDLAQRIDIQVPVMGQGVTSARTKDWATKYERLPARVQPVKRSDFDERGKAATMIEYEVFVDRQIAPLNDDGDWGRVVADGKVLEITAYQDAERIGDLPKLTCVLHP